MTTSRKVADVETQEQVAVAIHDESEESTQDFLAKEEYVLLSYQDTPRFLRSAFILSGYRSYFSSRLIALSLFRVHNESVNVWSHFGGLLYFGYAAVQHVRDRPTNFTWVDMSSMLVFYVSAALCMLLSALFHLAGCHSPQLHVTLYRFDLTGICCLVLGSYWSGLYLGFYCHRYIQLSYLGAVSLLLAAALRFITAERFGGQKYHPYRVTLLVCVVAFSLVPIIHWVTLATSEQLAESLWGVLSMLLLYLSGFAFYWTQVPERCQPGTFDIWGSSHQLWHVCVFLAALMWERTLWGYARLAIGPPCA